LALADQAWHQTAMLRWKFVQIAVVCALLVGGACSSDGADEPPEQTGDARSIDDELVSGVGVLALGCGSVASAGSGVVLGASGQVVTVAHTVAGATSIRVVGADGTEFDASVVAFDADADLAVLDVDGFNTPALAVGDVRLGDGTQIRWSIDEGVTSRQVEITQRLAITIDDIYGSATAQRSGFEFSGEVIGGDSGGPIISSNGDVLGIVYARSRSRPSTAFATDADQITAVLAAAGTDPVDNGTCV
jgi:S1-C subfamily serine protease